MGLRISSFSSEGLAAITLTIVVLFTPIFANASVILSNCPVETTEDAGSVVDRFKPDDFRLTIRSYSSDVPRLMRYLTWLFYGEKTNPQSQKEAREIGEWYEDIQLAMELSAEKEACHGVNSPKTSAQAIFPFIRKTVATPTSPAEYRVRYKLCDYYVREKSQIPFEDQCVVLGRDAGYTFQELDNRYAQLSARVNQTRERLQVAIAGAGLVGTWPAFRVLRLFRLGALPSLGLGAAASGGTAAWALHADLADDMMRDMVDLQAGAEVAVKGDLTTAVQVSRPMQDFAGYFERYLKSLD